MARKRPSPSSGKSRPAGGKKKPKRKTAPRSSGKRQTNPGSHDRDTMTLRRFLAGAGLDSRRNCDEYITTERVTVDGEVVTEPSTIVEPSRQRICVDGERRKLEPRKYFLLNKPKGYLCTNRDPRGRARAVDLVTAPGLRLFTVGRLDENSEGLLLVTNDGDLANKLAHPRYQVHRKYRVQIAGIPKSGTLAELKKGLYFKDGRFRLSGARRLKTQGKSSFLEVEMTEGQNREIRRLFARVGHKVMQLQRVAFGPLKLGRLPSGKFRPLRPPELKQLKAFVAELSAGKPRRGGPKTRPKSSKRSGKGDQSESAAAPSRGPRKKKATGRKSARTAATTKKKKGARRKS